MKIEHTLDLKEFHIGRLKHHLAQLTDDGVLQVDMPDGSKAYIIKQPPVSGERAAKAMGSAPRRLGLQIHVERKLMAPYLCIYLTWDGERIAGDFININEVLTP